MITREAQAHLTHICSNYNEILYIRRKQKKKKNLRATRARAADSDHNTDPGPRRKKQGLRNELP